MIIVSGVHSSGKTTLAKNLAKYFHSKAHIVESRQTDNPLYDKAKWTISCSYDEDFLMERMKQVGEAMTEPYTVFDRSVYEDVLRMKISADLGFLDQEEVEEGTGWNLVPDHVRPLKDRIMEFGRSGNKQDSEKAENQRTGADEPVFFRLGTRSLFRSRH